MNSDKNHSHTTEDSWKEQGDKLCEEFHRRCEETLLSCISASPPIKTAADIIQDAIRTWIYGVSIMGVLFMVAILIFKILFI